MEVHREHPGTHADVADRPQTSLEISIHIEIGDLEAEAVGTLPFDAGFVASWLEASIEFPTLETSLS